MGGEPGGISCREKGSCREKDPGKKNDREGVIKPNYITSKCKFHWSQSIQLHNLSNNLLVSIEVCTQILFLVI